MVFRRVTHRCSVVRDTVAAATRWAAPAAENIEQQLAPYLRAGESLPDVALLQELVGRLLADRGAALEGRGEQQERSERETRALRWQRDEAATALRESLRGARFYFEEAEGRGSGARRGLGHGLSRLPAIFLARLGGETAQVLAAAGPSEKNRAAGLADPAHLAQVVAERARQLEELLGELRPQNSGRNNAIGEKRRSLAETESLIRRCSAFLAGLYKLGELPNLAEKVRPALRRTPRRRTSAVKDLESIAPAPGPSGDLPA